MIPAFTASTYIYKEGKKNKIRFWVLLLLFAFLIILFLPWTQNIRAGGQVTTLRQEQRPQQINTIIGGSVEKWFVKEGDYVKKGDTILLLSEVKAEYLDPNLLPKTAEQIKAKDLSVSYYQNKIATADNQLTALKNALQVKLVQLQNKLAQAKVKIQSDSMDRLAADNDFAIISLQYNRQKLMYDSGLVSLTQLEARNQLYQTALAKKMSSENKFLAAQQEYGIVRLEFSAVQQEYLEKFAKAEGDRLGSLSMVAAGQGDKAKLEIQYASYAIRNGMYYILAPQSGQIIKIKASGIGEVLKEGEAIATIVPLAIDYAVQLYIRPVDLPLVATGQRVRFLFDGFPAIVFSGWPEASYGTYDGVVSAIESEVSENGKFKVLVKQDSTHKKWPLELRMGTGANGIALLKNVPLWYELWRNINAFPPDYYQPLKKEKKK